MRESTQQQLIQEMRNFRSAQLSKLRKITLGNVRSGYPFHRIVFSDAAILAARQERSIVTAMGKGLYQRIAATIARDRYSEVYTDHPITGTLNDAAINMIGQNRYRTSH